jgi:hypothetical protein
MKPESQVNEHPWALQAALALAVMGQAWPQVPQFWGSAAVLAQAALHLV